MMTFANHPLYHLVRWSAVMGLAVLALSPRSSVLANENAGDGPRIVNDIAYKEGDNLSDYERTRCKLDLYLPDAATKAFPVVVWFHGGGLVGGDKDSGEPLGKRLASEGIAMVCVNYRLSPKATYPAYNEDAAASVAWVKKHIAEYGGDADRLFVAGHSAGGYLAAIVGYDPKLLKKFGMSTDDLSGLVLVAPQVFTHFEIRAERGIDNPQTTPVIDEGAPAFYMRKDAPPTLILLGDHDWPVRLEECQYFVSMLHHIGHPDVNLHVIPDRDHGAIGEKLADKGDPGLKLILNFIKSHSEQESADDAPKNANENDAPETLHPEPPSRTQ